MFNFFKKQPAKQAYKRKYNNFTEKNSLGKELATRDRVDWSVILGILPDPDEILSSANKDFTVYRQLMIDSQVRACANSRKSGTLSLLWEIDKGKAKSNQAKLIEEIYSGLDIDSLNNAILNAPMFGFQPIEIIWGKQGNYIVPVNLVPKNPEWFNFDNESKLRLLTMGSALIGEELPDRKFLTPTYNDINNYYYNPYGDRILSSCFWAVTFKKSGFKWWVTFAEKYGMPYILGKMPRNTLDSEREAMKDDLESMVMDAVAVITDDSSIEIIEAGGKNSSSDLYDKLIANCDASISKAILGQTLTTDAGSKGSGSYALGKVHGGVRQDIVDTDKKIVERTHNQLIKWIIDINFGKTNIYPKYSMFAEEDVDEVLAKRDAILVNQGVRFNKDYYVDNYNLDEKYFEVQEPQKEKTAMPNAEQEEDKEYSEFQDNKESDLDLILSMFSNSYLQNQIEQVLKPVLKGINNSKDYAEVKKIIEKISPEMTSIEIENSLARVLFTVQSMGRFDVKKKA